MENNQPVQAVMTITVDQKLNVQTHYQGHPSLMLGMTGGLEYAKQWCIGQLQAREDPLWTEEKSKQNLLVTVTREEAMKQYYAAFDLLRARLEAVTNSSEQATFQVPSFLKQL